MHMIIIMEACRTCQPGKERYMQSVLRRGEVTYIGMWVRTHVGGAQVGIPGRVRVEGQNMAQSGVSRWQNLHTGRQWEGGVLVLFRGVCWCLEGATCGFGSTLGKFISF